MQVWSLPFPSASAVPLILWITGTGGTISGTSAYLRSMNPDVKIVLSDPEGSGLYNKIKYGVMFDYKEKEGSKRR